MKNLVLIVCLLFSLLTSCEPGPFDSPHGDNNPGNHVRKYSASVAHQWIALQQHLIKTTPGFDPLVASRSFAYSGVALYESVVKGMPGYRSIMSAHLGTDNNFVSKHSTLHWPSSANAAMAYMLKNLFANTSDANKAKIDSLENAINMSFATEADAVLVDQSVEYGRKIATDIFEWSKTDGGHEAYLGATNSDYVAPTGPGMWIPTPAAFSAPIRPYWGNNRSFVPNIAQMTLPPPPPAFSTEPGSDFHVQASAVYNASLSLTTEQINMIKTWADLPGNYGTPAHYTHIATQLLMNAGLKLDETAFAYAKHGIALYEATICVFKAKYTYNLIRPVSYIRDVLQQPSWSSVVGTPPHPEYPSAHAVIGGASCIVLESFFGKNYAFTDRTHESLYGSRSYPNLKAYAAEASLSRVLGGLHYQFSAETGLAQGEKVGKLVNQLPFKTASNAF